MKKVSNENKAMTFQVLVDDNFHYMDKSARTCAGEYQTAEKALARAKDIVDSYLQDIYKDGMTANQLYDHYVAMGEDPYIVGPEMVDFSAWNYARQRAAELAAKTKK